MLAHAETTDTRARDMLLAKEIVDDVIQQRVSVDPLRSNRLSVAHFVEWYTEHIDEYETGEGLLKEAIARLEALEMNTLISLATQNQHRHSHHHVPATPSRPAGTH